jgi:predicted RNase H-like nuclease (RuvC/YqgF family)
MSESYLNLKKKYDALMTEHAKLKQEYSENFLIESMNDMKKTFEEKELEIKVLSNSIERLRNMNYHLCENLSAVQIMLTTVHKSMRQINNPTTSDVYQLELKLKFVDEIIVQCLKTRDELLFSSLL